MKVKNIIQWIGGFTISYFLSPLSPLITVPLLTNLINLGIVSEKTHFWFVIILAIISFAIPLLGFFLLRKQLPSFSWGLLIGLLVFGVSGYFLIFGIRFFANY